MNPLGANLPKYSKSHFRHSASSNLLQFDQHSFIPARMRRGFTLVEISIVLVIIGLLIGGILVAQSMIETARIQSQIRQLEQFDIAISNFHQRYNSLPGDTRLMTLSGATTGDGDGLIEGTGFFNTQEMHNVWKHLSQSSILQDVYTNTPNSFSVGTHSPKLIISAYSGGELGVAVRSIAGLNKNYYTFIGSKINPTLTFYNEIHPNESVALDTKIDDGNGNTGIFVARKRSSGGDPAGWDDENIEGSSPQSCVDATGKYKSTGACVNRLELPQF